MRILLTVPAFNEATHLPIVLAEILQKIHPEDLLVIDDGSTDATAVILQKVNCRVIRHQHNLGKGASILHAIEYAKNLHYDWLLCMDGDGQHDPRDLRLFWEQIQRNDADVILGNRWDRRGRMPWHRQLSNGISSLVISLLLNRNERIFDSQCGFRALRLASLQAAWFSEKGFQFESELLLVLGRRGHIFRQIPVHTRYNRQKSNIHLLYDTCKFLKLVIKNFW